METLQAKHRGSHIVTRNSFFRLFSHSAQGILIRNQFFYLVVIAWNRFPDNTKNGYIPTSNLEKNF